MRIINLILAFSIGSYAFSQDAKADFKKINQAYFALEKLSMNVSYELFYDNSINPSDKETGVYKKNKNNYYIKQTNNVLVINEKFMLVIDNDNKTIILDKALEKVEPINPLKMDFDSLFYFYSKVEFYKTGKNKGLNAYTFTLKSGPYSQIDVVFDPNTFLVREITNTYREKMADETNTLRKTKLKTIFSDINANPTFKNEFNELNYVANGNNTIKLNSTYLKYKLLTNLKKL